MHNSPGSVFFFFTLQRIGDLTPPFLPVYDLSPLITVLTETIHNARPAGSLVYLF